MSERKKRSRRIGVIVFLSILLVLSLLVLAGIRLFRVQNVEVSGNELYDDDAIRELVLNNKYSWNTLYVYGSFKFRKGEKLPFVDEMDMKLLAPDTLQVTVYEKGLIGYAYRDTDGSYIYFDKDGFVIDIRPDATDTVPEIRGVNAYGADIMEKLEIPEKTLRWLLTATQDLNKYDLHTELIEFGEDSNMYLHFGNVVVNMGNDAHTTEKILRLQKILPEISSMSGVLDLSTWTEETTDIVFTPG